MPTCSATGEKLDLWIIRKSKNPRSFGKNNYLIKNLPIHYYFNTKSWMTGIIFIEYLQWFDRKMTGRKVLLLIDGFSAHEATIKQLDYDNFLLNTRIEFLPVNTTALYQPYNQGIINNLKVHYRKQWFQSMTNLFLNNKDLLKHITFLQTIH